MSGAEVGDPVAAFAAQGKRSESHAMGAPSLKGRGRLIEWCRRWRMPIRGWIETCVPSAEVDDLTQDVFMRLLRYSDDVLVENPQGYLFRVTANVVHEWRRRCRVRMAHDRKWLNELRVASGDEPQNAYARASETEYVRTEVHRLPVRQREILLMHVEEGLTYEKIAQIRGLTRRAVMRDLARAYSTLRMRCLAEGL